MAQIKGTGFRVERDEHTASVTFEGTLRLAGVQAYIPIARLLHETGEQPDGSVTLDMRNLKFLNCTGLNMLYRFALELGRKGGKRLIIRGSNAIPWQKRVLSNLDRFIHDLELSFS